MPGLHEQVKQPEIAHILDQYESIGPCTHVQKGTQIFDLLKNTLRICANKTCKQARGSLFQLQFWSPMK